MHYTKNKYIIKDNYAILIITKKDKSEKEVYISLCDLEKVRGFKYSWCASWFKCAKCYYIQACVYLGKIDGKYKYTTVKLHNFLMDAKEHEVVDHKNHDTLDNRRDNLRVTETLKNTKHRETRNSNNSSGYRNVSKVDNQWLIQLQIDGKNTRLKQFPLDQLDEAGVYAELMRQKYYGEYAGSN